MLLPAGTHVDITQTLGGSYTVSAAGGLFRIAGEDADALGLKPAPAPPAAAPAVARGGQVDEERVYEALRGCYDPEIPVNIVDLGLIYDLQIQPARGGHRVGVKMTLTAPGCGMGPSIAGDARRQILQISGVADAEVQVVWDPPWCSDMMSPAAKKQLGVS